MRKGEKCVGMRYATTVPNLWSGYCPYNIRHKNNILSCRNDLSKRQLNARFDKWHNIGWKVRNRHSAHPYKLFWRTSYFGMYK